MPSVIAEKIAAKNNPEYGLIRPIILEGEQPSKYRTVNPYDFPRNGQIFVLGDYRDINSAYTNGELFRLTEYEENTDISHRDEPGYAEYICFSSHVKPLSRNEYFHVIDAKLEPSEPIISIDFEPKRLIMLRPTNSDTLYGPLDYEVLSIDVSEVRIRLRACLSLTGFSLHDQYSVYKFDYNKFETITLGGQSVLLADLKELAQSDHEATDYILDDQLIKLANESGIVAKRDFKSYRDAVVTFSELSHKFDSTRRNRLVAIANRLEFWKDRSTLISEFLRTKEGELELSEYLKRNRQQVLAEAKNEFSGELETERQVLQDAIVLLKNQKQILEQENKMSEAEIASKREIDLTLKIQELETQQSAEQENLQQITEKLHATAEKLGLAEEIEALREERDVLREDEKYLTRKGKDLHNENKGLEDVRDRIRREIQGDQVDLKKELAKLKPYIDVLNGISYDNSSTEHPVLYMPKQRNDVPGSPKELITEIHQVLSRNGRNFDFDQVANFVVSIHQNFLTVFAGLPGVGKTSLATYLAKALGMEDRLLYIAVARGMTSLRDLLGFYNPLVQRYQSAPTGLFDMLIGMREEKFQFPSWVLLDEANLSPIEHYFSNFLPMCDSDNKSREIKTGDLGDNAKIVVPDPLRFLATINYDNTTEPLSPRMIDRVPIIKLEPSDRADTLNALESTVSSLLSYNDLNRLLSPDGKSEFNDVEEDVFSGLYNVLRDTHDGKWGLPVIISTRKQNAICRFCSTARELMKGSDGPSLRALDYAISQYVLPLINGNGDQYRSRLVALLEAVKDLDITKSQLKYMIEVGDNEHKFYRFFC